MRKSREFGLEANIDNWSKISIVYPYRDQICDNCYFVLKF